MKIQWQLKYPEQPVPTVCGRLERARARANRVRSTVEMFQLVKLPRTERILLYSLHFSFSPPFPTEVTSFSLEAMASPHELCSNPTCLEAKSLARREPTWCNRHEQPRRRPRLHPFSKVSPVSHAERVTSEMTSLRDARFSTLVKKVLGCVISGGSRDV